MEVKNISIKNDLNEIPNIENGWCYVYVTLDDDRTYIVQVLTYKNFLQSEDKKTLNFISLIAPSIIVKELTKETIESLVTVKSIKLYLSGFPGVSYSKTSSLH